MKRCPSILRAALVLAVASLVSPSRAYLHQRIERDFLALTRKVTARHILLPKSRDAALALTRRIRTEVAPRPGGERRPRYVVDVFAAAARRFSRDNETAANGGLIGTLVPQGYCRFRQVDEACFEGSVPLGEVITVEGDHGYHLLLVQERVNCDDGDGRCTRIVRGADGTSKVLVGDTGREGDARSVTRLVARHMGLMIGVSMAGGLAATAVDPASQLHPLVAASVANSVDMRVMDPAVAVAAMGLTPSM